MADLLSPGVLIQERDLTAVVPAVSTSTGAVAIDATWGPVGAVTMIDSEGTLVKTYGKPQSGNAPSWFTAANFLSYSNSLYVARTDTTNQRNAVAQLTGSITSIPLTTTPMGSNYISGYVTVNIPAPNVSGGTQATATAVVSGGQITGITITNAGTGYTSAPTVTLSVPASGTGSTGTGATIGTVTVATGGIKINNEDIYTASFINGNGNLVGQWSAAYPGALGNSLTVSTCDAGGWGAWAYANQFTGAPGNSTWASANGVSNDELHVVVIDNSGQWSGTAGTVLEKYAFVSKHPNAKYPDGTSSYYKNAINVNSAYLNWMDHPVYQTAGNAWGSTSTGAFSNMLTGTVQAGTITTTTSAATVTGVGTAFAATDVGKALYTSTGVLIGTITTYTSATAVTLTANATVALTGQPFIATGSAGTVTTTTSSPTVTGTGTSFTTADIGKALYSDVGVFVGTIAAFTSATSVALAANAAVALTSKTFSLSAAQTVALVGGVDHLTSTDGQKMDAYTLFQNTEQFDISLVMAGKADTTVANYIIQSIAEFRKDCVAFVSPEDVSSGASIIGTDSTMADKIVAYRNALTSSSYAMMDTGVKYQYDRYNDTYRWIPMNGDIAGLCARTDQTNDAWWSPAGYNRGQLKNVVKLGYNPRQTDRDTLYKAGVNPIVSFPGQGVVLYGDKTLQAKPSAFDRINVRRLFITLEKAIGLAAKYQLFEFNDAFTRAQFVGMVTPFLRDVQGRRGIVDFRVVADETNNTMQVIDTNKFVGDIYVKPVRSINYLQLNFVATKTGVAFSEVAGSGTSA